MKESIMKRSPLIPILLIISLTLIPACSLITAIMLAADGKLEDPPIPPAPATTPTPPTPPATPTTQGSLIPLAGHNSPTGIWSDGSTMWVADWEDAKIYAYTMSTKTRDSAKDFTALAGAAPRGIWSDGTTMWAVDYADNKIYAYSMAGKARDSAKDFNNLIASAPQGIWSDGTTMWAADYVDNKIYAYSMADKTRDSAKDFTTLAAAGNTNPEGIWSDGATMWVTDYADKRIYAYSMADKTRDSAKDFTTLAAGNTNPKGIWSDGTTMWAADPGTRKIHAYDMPRGTGAGTGTTTPGGSTGGGSARTVTHGSSVAGSISTPGERDRYSVALSAGQTLTAYTTGSTDTFGIFEDSGGTSLATNDDGGSGRNFRLSHTVSAEGTYYIIVRGYSRSTTGNYQLNVSISGGTTTSGTGGGGNSGGTGSGTIIYSENYESYSVNSLPPNYIIYFNGAGNSEQRIEREANGNRYLRTSGKSNWAAAVRKDFDSDFPDKISVTIRMRMHVPYGHLYIRNAAGIGGGMGIRLSNGKMLLACPEPGGSQPEIQRDTWNTLRFDVDFANRRQVLYLNGTKYCEQRNLGTIPRSHGWSNKAGVQFHSSNNARTVTWFDDIVIRNVTNTGTGTTM